MSVRSALVLALFGLASCSSPAQRVDPQASRSEPREPSAALVEQAEEFASIGDTLLISDSCNPAELTLRKKIDVDGTILLPELGAVAVAGYTRAELRKLLTEKWSPYFPRLDIEVEIAKTCTRKYFIYGEVGSPGEKPILGDLTLFEAVMQAGPSTSAADLGRVRLIRADPRDPSVFEVDLRERLRERGRSPGLAVCELDIIYVPPTLVAQFGQLLERLRAWIREWILDRPILIARGQPA
jgi:protein involved in polysaccharide export with SLBB domain